MSPPSPADERRVDDLVVLAALRSRAAAGIERHLVRRGVEHARVAPENMLRAVAVVHVEIDDGDALDAMNGLSVARGDRRVVEEAKAHRGREFAA